MYCDQIGFCLTRLAPFFVSILGTIIFFYYAVQQLLVLVFLRKLFKIVKLLLRRKILISSMRRLQSFDEALVQVCTLSDHISFGRRLHICELTCEQRNNMNKYNCIAKKRKRWEKSFIVKKNLHAIDAWPTSWCHSFVNFVCDTLDLAAASCDLAAVALEVCQIWWQRGRRRCCGI